MAGLGRKVFNAGEVLSAANVQGYLQDQVVQVYSGTAARSSALGTAVSEGMMSYLTDANELSVYTSNGTAAWSPVNLAQSPNYIINGAMEIFQRGTTTNMSNGGYHYVADRFLGLSSFTAGTSVLSQQTFTPGTAPVAGYESSYFLRVANGTTATYCEIGQRVEDVRTLAGQTITFSFWAKASSAQTATITIRQNFGSGGSANVDLNTTVSLTTSWQRFTITQTLGSMTGKTIGTGSYIWIFAGISGTLGSVTFDTWGWQLEAGSVATPFRRSSPTLQGELAACQRYYYEESPLVGSGYSSGLIARANALHPVDMRTSPTVTLSNAVQFLQGNTTLSATGSITNYSNTRLLQLDVFISSGGSVGQACSKIAGSGKITVSAEL